MNCHHMRNADELAYNCTHQERLGQGQNLILGQVSILVLVVEVEEPLDVLHEVIEHNAVQT